MTHNTSVKLDDHSTALVGEQVQSGRFGSASDVVRAGLRLLEEREATVRDLQAALVAGEQSGDPVPFDFDAFKAGKRAA